MYTTDDIHAALSPRTVAPALRPLRERLARWRTCVEMVRNYQRDAAVPDWVHGGMFAILMGWAESLVGEDAPEQWRVPNGCEALHQHLLSELDTTARRTARRRN